MKPLWYTLCIVMALLTNNYVNAQMKWNALGGVGFSSGICNYTSLALDTNGVPYIAFLDGTMGGKASVMKFNGTNWTLVGNAGFSGFIMNNTSLAFDKNNTPYVAYQDRSNSAKAAVMKFNGSAWVAVGNIGFSAGQAMYISIAFNDNNVPYVSYQDMSNGQKVTVMKYNGTNWIAEGNVGFSAGQSAYISLAFDNNTPYVAYKDAGNNFKASVMKYNGSNWVNVGIAGFSTGQADYTNLAIYNGTPYVLFSDVPNSQTACVMKYDGTNWNTVGSAGFSGGYAGENDIVFDKTGTPYIVYKDGTQAARTTVRKFDGTNWTLVGNAGFSDGDLYYPSLAVDKNGMPYVGYMDWFNGQKATVMGFGCPQQVNTVNICAATTDSATGKNIIMWDRWAYPHTDSYRIYRENGSYTLLGTVGSTVQSFIDATSNPTAQSYKYKLTVLDSCSRETLLDSSVMHKTIRLSLKNLIGGAASIIWNKYEGVSNLVYTVKRSTNGGPFINLASFKIVGIDTTYIDNTISIGNNKYRIDAALSSLCNTGSISYNNITSNILNVAYTKVDDLVEGSNIILTPNPAGNNIKVTAKENIFSIDILNMLGRQIISEKYYSIKEATLNLDSFSPGVYLLKVNGLYFTRFIKK